MKVSIIIPVYNVEEYIEDCIRSVLAQSFRDFEIILVDDCGWDRSVALAENLLEKYEDEIEYKVISHERNKGLSAARNTGVDEAQGEYVFFLDSDDSLAPDCLEVLVRTADATSADVTIGDIRIDGERQWIPGLKVHTCHTSKSETADYVPIEGKEEVLKSYLQGEWYVMAWNKLLRRDFLRKSQLSFVDGLIHEDNPWSFELACCAERIALVCKQTYLYRVRDNSLQTDSDFLKHFTSYKNILHEIASIIKRKDVLAESQSWFEHQKALFFAETLNKGTREQAYELYHIIRNLYPYKHLTKSDVHYLLPSFVGFFLYRKFHRYYLC